MKLFNYFLAFNAIAQASWVFNFILMSEETSVESFIICSTIFSVLSAVALYNINQGKNANKGF